MPPFLEMLIKRSLSREEIDKVIGTLTDMLECINLEVNLQKTDLMPLKIRFDIDHTKRCDGFPNLS